jgi:alpha-tubulin suppressor-like RCC1 family protein
MTRLLVCNPQLRLRATAVSGGRQYNQVSASGSYSCGVTTAGKAFCWGSNPLGEFGNGTLTSTLTPTAAATGLVLAQLNAGERHGCGVTPEGRAYCWGDNRAGQLGDGTQLQRRLPVPVAGP